MKKHLSTILFVLIFVVGFGIFSYPKISDQWNKYHQSAAMASYDKAVSNLDKEDYDSIWNEAIAYNASIKDNSFPTDAFADEETNLRETEYWKILNPQDDGIMGYISIPLINQKLPIYHGTSESVLQVGAGHMNGTKLPIGGDGNHSVICAHRGLPSAELFSNLDELQIGDKFYIHVLDEIHAYQVDQILPMIDKNDIDTLTASLKNVEGEDYVTLFTCTPYGINTHRLLVRGHRVAYHGEEDEKTPTPTQSMVKSVKDYYMLYLLMVIAMIVVLSAIIGLIKRIVKRR